MIKALARLLAQIFILYEWKNKKSSNSQDFNERFDKDIEVDFKFDLLNSKFGSSIDSIV